MKSVEILQFELQAYLMVWANTPHDYMIVYCWGVTPLDNHLTFGHDYLHRIQHVIESQLHRSQNTVTVKSKIESIYFLSNLVF